MVRYNILETDPFLYEDKIAALWDAHLPGTNAARLNWLKEGNPAGETLWFLAFEEGTNELAGTISVMPRTFYCNGVPVRAGIMGDFMVVPKSRAYGPGLTLPKTVISRLCELGFELIYTLPNPASHKIVERGGLRSNVALRHFVRPISVKNYLRKVLPRYLADLITPLGDLCLTFASRETYMIATETVREEDSIDSSFDTLWEKVRAASHELIGERCSKYLRWRYMNNPQARFRLITYRDKSAKDLLGYLFFSVNRGKIEVFDLIALERLQIYALLNRLVHLAKTERCQSVYIRMLEVEPLASSLKRCWFIDARDDTNILYESRTAQLLDGWFFLNGDRNI
jgi:hypothetical protein